MFIDRVAKQIFRTEQIRPFMRPFDAGDDCVLSLSQSARTLMCAALFVKNPRPLLFVQSGEEAAKKTARTLAAWLGQHYVLHYPELTVLPWSKKEASFAEVGARTQAVLALHEKKPICVVTSARALLRRVPQSTYFKPLTLQVQEQKEPAQVGEMLQELGYSAPGELDGPGTFHLHQDLLDIFPSQLTHAIRVEFFGDEIDRIRTLLGTSAQSIGELESITIQPAREYALSPKTVAAAKRALWDQAQQDSQVAADLEAIEAMIPNARTELYQHVLHGELISPLAHMSDETLVVLNEPRALLDDAIRATEELHASASKEAKRDAASEATHYTSPAALDFGTQQRVSFSALQMAGMRADAELSVRTPNVRGSEEKLLSEVHGLCQQNFSVAFAVPRAQAREEYALSFSDHHVPFKDASRLKEAERALGLQHTAQTFEAAHELSRGYVTFFDAALPIGTIFPEAHLAIFSQEDVVSVAQKRATQEQIDVTQITFPFKPGDYVVHAVHGVAKFAGITRQGRPGEEQDYFQLDYAEGDKLFVPLSQLVRITRYVGISDAPPKLTRLKSGEWSRTIDRARKNAKKLAFDLVDLYARRVSAEGIAFEPDTPEQREMEMAFPYELTSDQARAIEEVKADMEDLRPMDRLLSGDVGFGKTEVALRAAFKAVQAGRQVLVLCPTTILAQQHFETFLERFAPFGVSVDVLSRFRTTAQQKQALKKLAEGTLDVLVGTHRLLSPDVAPKNLGLVIVDEEQRFGVSAKEQLKNLRTQIDVLTLSATPIPRTLQMSLSGVRDMSLIMTPPKGRLPVKVQVEEYNLDTVGGAIRNELSREGQVYYVSNRVASIDDAVARVKEAAPEARIGVAHGQMTPAQVERVMYDFAAQKIDVLVATTIIESGLDNPHTNTLIIEDSEKLGLAQLYQLKGRVGRGHMQAYAYFMFSPHKALTKEAAERLVAIDEYQELGSGIRIAMRDLEIRGAGSIIGAEQHGNVSRIGFDLFMELLSRAVDEAKGELPEETSEAEPIVDFPGQYFLSNDYIEAIDERVLSYRRIAHAKTHEALLRVEQGLQEHYGALDEPSQNLLVRQAVLLCAKKLGITHMSVQANRLVLEGIKLSKKQTVKLEGRGARIFVMSRKMTYPLSAAEKPAHEALALLKELDVSS